MLREETTSSASSWALPAGSFHIAPGQEGATGNRFVRRLLMVPSRSLLYQHKEVGGLVISPRLDDCPKESSTGGSGVGWIVEPAGERHQALFRLRILAGLPGPLRRVEARPTEPVVDILHGLTPLGDRIRGAFP